MMRGLTGVIEMASGNLTIHPHEDLDIEPQGITIHHNDLYDTKTFIPVFTIKMIRYHQKAREKDGPNVSGAELANKKRKGPFADSFENMVLDEQTKELSP